jgi:hypothetical protein
MNTTTLPSVLILGTVEVEAREIYGVTKYFPHNDCAQLFAEIAGTRTLTRDTLRLIKALGYEVTQHVKPLEIPS